MSEADKLEITAPQQDLAAKPLVFSVRNLEKSFALPSGGRLEVLKGASLEIQRGEFLVIEGKSGIGKSTLLHLLGLLDRPDRGEIIFEGQEVGSARLGMRAKLRATRIGFVFQFYYLLPEFTALENIMLPGKIEHSMFAWLKRRDEATERAMELLESVGIADRAKHYPNQLSGGERQRVALARALFNKPAVMLCDEPTGNLDVKTSDSIHRLLSDLNRETGQTMVVVTHDTGLAQYAQRVVRLEDGQFQATAGEAPSLP